MNHDYARCRYWHMAEDGCYIMALSSMEHHDCPTAPDFVRGEKLVKYLPAVCEPAGVGARFCTCQVRVAFEFQHVLM